MNKESQLLTVKKSFYRDVIHNLLLDDFPLVKVNWNKKTMILGFDSGHTETILGKNMIEELDNLKKTLDSTVGLDGSPFSK